MKLVYDSMSSRLRRAPTSTMPSSRTSNRRQPYCLTPGNAGSVTGCRVLKRDGDSVIGYQRISAPMTSDRDYTIRVHNSSKKVEGGTTYLSRWTTDNAAGPPEKRGVIRVNLCEGSWLLEPIEPDRTRATYLIYTDSGGWIPKFIKESGSQIGIRKLFAAIRKQVRDPKYTKNVRQD